MLEGGGGLLPAGPRRQAPSLPSDNRSTLWAAACLKCCSDSRGGATGMRPGKRDGRSAPEAENFSLLSKEGVEA